MVLIYFTHFNFLYLFLPIHKFCYHSLFSGAPEFLCHNLVVFKSFLVLSPKVVVCILEAQKPIRRPDWWKGKLALLQTRTAGETIMDSSPKANAPPTDNQWARVFIGEGRVVCAQSGLTVLLKLATGGLIGLILSTVSLHFQGWLVPISLKPVLKIVVAYVMATVWSSYN